MKNKTLQSLFLKVIGMLTLKNETVKMIYFSDDRWQTSVLKLL